MKSIYLALLTLGVAFAVPALAGGPEVKTLGGCELKVAANSGGQNYNKVDPDCEFAWANDDGEDRELADTDGDPSTPPERVGF